MLTALVALFTTLCCLGFPALVGVLATLGMGFLISDRYLEPLLVATLLLALVIAALHIRRHHQPGPFILSAVAAGSVFFAVYGVGLLPHASGGDHMADGMAATPTWSPTLAYGAMLVLLVAQVWDLWLFRRCAPLRCSQQKHERKVCNAPNWWWCLDNHGLSGLSLSLDSYVTAAGNTLRRNSPGQFSEAEYEPGHDLRSSLLCRSTGNRVLALDWPKTLETGDGYALSHLYAR